MFSNKIQSTEYKSWTQLLCLYAILIAVFATQLNALEFRNIYQVARELESSGHVLGNSELDTVPNRTIHPVNLELKKLELTFIKTPKFDINEKHDTQLKKAVKEVRSKTLSVLNNGAKSNSFMRGFVLFVSNIKGWASFDQEIATYADGLNWLIENGQLTQEKVDCAMNNLQSKHYQIMMFVLKTDLKYLILNDVGLLNRAIFSNLESQRFSSKHDFYNFNQLTPTQQEAFMEFYKFFKDTKDARVEEFLDHVINPGRFIIGRLMDTCSAVVKNYPNWLSARTNQDSCLKTMPDVIIFRTSFMTDDNVELINRFCQDFLQ